MLTTVAADGDHYRSPQLVKMKRAPDSVDRHAYNIFIDGTGNILGER